MRTWLVIAVLVPALAGAEPRDGAKVDWVRGLVIADGIGVADRHAPNPAVARGTSRRVAEDAAKQKLAAQLPKLALAGGGKVGDRIADPSVRAQLDRVVAAAMALDAEPETDGAWHVTMAVPIEAVNQVIAGPRELPAAGDTGPPVIVIDGANAKPAIGWTINKLAAAAIWTAELPAWAKDAPHVTGKAKGSAIEIAAGTHATAATLFVIVSP